MRLQKGALDIPVSPHSVVVADRGYCDFSLLDYWDNRNVFLYPMAYIFPVKSIFSDVVLSYKTLFYHFRKWYKNGRMESICEQIF